MHDSDVTRPVTCNCIEDMSGRARAARVIYIRLFYMHSQQ